MNKQVQETLFSSRKDDWETPNDLFVNLNKRYGPFTLDAAAFATNSKCNLHFNPEHDGLKQSWQGHKVWVNPPYGRNITGLWIKKAWEECYKEDTTVTMLLPSRTGTKWYYEYCMNASEILFIKGRLKFIGAKDCAPFPSIVVHFKNPLFYSLTMIGSIDIKGNDI